jgi:hypothetical protein
MGQGEAAAGQPRFPIDQQVQIQHPGAPASVRFTAKGSLDRLERIEQLYSRQPGLGPDHGITETRLLRPHGG